MYAWFALTPLEPEAIAAATALARLPAYLSETWDRNIVLGLGAGLPLGFFCLGAFWPQSVSSRLPAVFGVASGLLLLLLCTQWGQLYYRPEYQIAAGWFGQALGVVLGMSCWWLAAGVLHGYRAQPAWNSVLWRTLLVAGVLLAAIPLDWNAPLLDGAISSTWPGDLPQRLYGLIKSAVLWVPLAYLIALSGHKDYVFGLGIALPIGLLMIGWPHFGQMSWRDGMEVFFALPGLWLGAWLGRATYSEIWSIGQQKCVKPNGMSPVPTKLDRAVDESVRSTAGPEKQFEDSSIGGRSHGAQIDAPGGAERRVWTFRPAFGYVAIAAGMLLFVLALVEVWDFPRWNLLLGLGLVTYAGLLFIWPNLWLIVVPASLPLLDFVPWTGRFFFDEFDLLMLVTASILLMKRGRTNPVRPMAPIWLGLFLLAGLISMLIGLWPLPALDANAFSSYWSQYNALRVAKGFVWGCLIFLWLRRVELDMQLLAMRLAMGMGVGLTFVGLIGVWEHHLFAELDTYRIVSTFSSMHTGGGHIEAYLVAALPFLWLATSRLLHIALTGPVLILTTFVVLYTVARGGVLALGVVLVILMVASLREAVRNRGLRHAIPVIGLVAAGILLASGVGVGYFHQRFLQVEEDWATRLGHWRQSLNMMDAPAGAQLFGMGLGSFPRVYQERGPLDKQPASFGFASEQGNTYFRMGVGETVYYTQRIEFTSGRSYRLEVDLRSRQGDTRLDTPVCEKQLLNSLQCEWLGFAVPGDGNWHRFTHTFSSAKVGTENWWRRPPVELSLYHPGETGVVDVDNMRLLDADGRDLLCNGDFAHGTDCWFFKTHSHLPWHIKNLWVHVLFEQGWVGLLLFATLTATALYRLSKAGWRGHRLAWAWLASLAGLLTVGFFDSLLDAPRLATLLLAWILLGVGYEWEPRLHGPRRSRRRKASVAALRQRVVT